MKIYKNVPEQFHSQFMDTINTIESGGIKLVGSL